LNQQVKKPGNPAWVKGVSGNAAGRPAGSRQRIAEKLVADIADIWETHGEAVLRHLATNEPAKFATIAYGLLPRDVFIKTEQAPPGDLTPDEWRALRRVVDLAIKYESAGADPETIFETVERALVAQYERAAIPPCPIPAPSVAKR
jgi:hypothetical protein